MLKLHGHVNKLSINVLKIRVALAEANAPYEYVPVDLANGQQRTPEFLSLNPHGKVPVLVDGDFVLPESDAILWYVAESFPEAHLLGTTPRARARTLEWCDFGSTALYPAYYELYSHTVSLSPDKRLHAVADGAQARLLRGLRVLEQVLGQRQWLADTYSIADIACGVVVRGIRERLPAVYDATSSPHTEGWFQRLLARPAWKAAVAG
jgi:glutathione S-transferase